MNYYYIVENRIVKFINELGCDYNYPRLSSEQAAFYKDHPNVSLSEIIACELNTPLPIASVNLEDYKERRLDELNRLSLTTAGRLSPSYARENAKISLDLILLAESGIASTQEPIYTKEKSIEIIAEANRIGGICRDESYRISELINQANTTEEVDMAYNSNQYETIN